ncbi:hypothetical protein IJD15_02285 [bacterium]|nr:hypothetical protein [bacterium]
MQNQIENNFGTLTKKKKKLYDITEILSSEKKVLDSLFKNSELKLEKLTVIEAERQAALENLRTLTSLLQTKRLRDKVKAGNKYFTL